VCSVWQHAVCFGLLQEEDVPEFHVCDQCAQSADDKCQSQGSQGAGYKCTDPFLQFLSPVALQVSISNDAYTYTHNYCKHAVYHLTTRNNIFHVRKFSPKL
jgi:protein-arginine kinase activator protein McsA